MRRILLSFLSALLLSGVARAQIPVTDAANITQSIVNSVTELVQTSTTAENMIGNFKETMKIYRQGKEYYDRLRNVTHLVRDARKVQQSILLVGELSDIYVTSYDKMLTDDNFSSQELSAIAAGYNKLLERGMNSLKDLKEIVNPTDYSMTDKERLDRIDQAHGELTHTRDLMVYYAQKHLRFVPAFAAEKRYAAGVGFIRFGGRKILVAMVMPLSDGMDIHFTSLHKILRNLYDQMTPLTDDIATFATAVAGLGALLYISYRVWQALARADAIDVFSLLRPFVIGLCIIGFRPIVVNSINGILKPLVVGTNHILKDQLLDMKELQKKKDRLEWEEAVRRKTYGVIDPNEDYDAELRALGLDVPTQSVMDTLYEVTHIFSTKYWVLQLFRWLLEILFGAAALVIDTLRTFYLVILTILQSASTTDFNRP